MIESLGWDVKGSGPLMWSLSIRWLTLGETGWILTARRLVRTGKPRAYKRTVGTAA